MAANVRTASRLVEQSGAAPGDLVVLPELWPTGYASKESLVPLAAEAAWEGFCREVGSAGIYLVGSAPCLDRGLLTNRWHLWGPSGLMGWYDKVHLFKPMREDVLFSPGSEVRPVALPGLVVGPVICYDLRFPELFRLLAVQGTTVFAMPAQFPDPKEDLWHIFLASRAAENQAYVVACNRTGAEKSVSFFGSSAVYDPLGRCLGRLGREEGWVRVPLDLDLVQETRRALPVLQETRLTIGVPHEPSPA